MACGRSRSRFHCELCQHLEHFIAELKFVLCYRLSLPQRQLLVALFVIAVAVISYDLKRSVLELKAIQLTFVGRGCASLLNCLPSLMIRANNCHVSDAMEYFHVIDDDNLMDILYLASLVHLCTPQPDC